MPYFDAASAEPMLAQARQALLAALDDGWADPARLHREGRRAALLLDAAREQVAADLGCRPDELSFTASGTQAAHLAVLGATQARQSPTRGPIHVIASAVEHSSVLNAATHASHAGAELTITPVGRTGRADVAAIAAALGQQRTVLACLQTANHEVGTLQPVAEVAGLCAAAGVPLLVDAAASAGREPLPAGWSLLVASAHKWGGPPGVGVLAVRRQVRWRSPLPGDSREGRRVPGFPNLPAIAAAAASLSAFREKIIYQKNEQSRLIARLRGELPELIPDCAVHGDPAGSLPHILAFSFLYLDGEALVTELDRAGFSVSSGSSCASETRQPSHVLEAMGALTHGNVRVSLPLDVTDGQVSEFLAVLPPIVGRLREQAGLPS